MRGIFICRQLLHTAVKVKAEKIQVKRENTGFCCVDIRITNTENYVTADG